MMTPKDMKKEIKDIIMQLVSLKKRVVRIRKYNHDIFMAFAQDDFTDLIKYLRGYQL